ncbi:phenazine biosynthesis protein phzE [Homoserinimonas aerilata]|uniref:anthranilate synthase n=1 Tax=Homoserinimonas aerilata TaxID=1162970 RepID=A0A542YKF8_9MICO|nr:anthranilate synthase family protein [Homoserinimonas aerilata]TQL48589.1 phenazine biosynthesis protein phzE [Homoserinimonas aerilata]
MDTLLSRLLASDAPLALIRRHDEPFVHVLGGSIVDVDSLDAIPLARDGVPADVLALVPFRQIAERGFEAKDDGTPLRCLLVDERETVAVDELLARLEARPGRLQNGAFDTSDADYARIVRTVIDDEIGAGQGANFVIRRDFEATSELPPRAAVLAWFRELLLAERGAYWTFAVHAPGGLTAPAASVSLVGASPERHISVEPDPAGGAAVATMNPISGTYRHPAGGPDPDGFLRFLQDAKETEELFMVVDEEMKMMSRICGEGGRIHGPFVKQMAALTHTEYVLKGRTRLAPVDVLRHSMFAPTVTGSPMQNACSVIARHETSGRGYYAGVLALFEAQPDGSHTLDAPILIRTAYVSGRPDGGSRVRVPVGATLVRHSDPESETAETWAKATGILRAIGALPRETDAPKQTVPRLADVPGAEALLAARNERLAGFWMAQQYPRPGVGGATLAGRSAVIIDAEDEFSAMLAHQLRAAGMLVEVRSWRSVTDSSFAGADLVVAGPGPGDPSDLADPRIARMHELVRDRVASGLPLLAVCLSHQVLCLQLGLPIERLASPHQGLALRVPMPGGPATVGFYNTFTALAPAGVELPGVELSVDPRGQVHAVQGEGFASVQGHLESVLSLDGNAVLLGLVERLLGVREDAVVG